MIRYWAPIGWAAPPSCDCLEMRDVARVETPCWQLSPSTWPGEVWSYLGPTSRANIHWATLGQTSLEIFSNKSQVVVVVGGDGTRAVSPPPMFNTCICNNIIMVVRLNTGLPSPLPPSPLTAWESADQLEWISGSSTGGRALVPTGP